MHTVHALGLQTGIAFPQLIAHPTARVLVVECAARIPGGQMADLVRWATGVDLVEVQLRMALGEELPDELVHAEVQAAARDPLPDGGAGAAADRAASSGSARSTRCSRFPASCRRTSTCRSARRSARCASTATAAAT